MLNKNIIDSLKSKEDLLIPDDQDETASIKSDGMVDPDEYENVTREISQIYSNKNIIDLKDIVFKTIYLGKEMPNIYHLNICKIGEVQLFG